MKTMTASDVLKKQHRQVEKLFAKALKAQKPRARRGAMDEIVRQLETHTSVEEDSFYPALKDLGTKKLEDIVLEAYEEHHVVKLVLSELPTIDPKVPTFKAKMTVLKELVEHHVEEEEEEMFPMAERRLGQGRSRDLAEKMATQARQETERRSS